MKTFATVSKIANGFLITNHETSESYFVKEFEINKLIQADGPVDHEKVLFNLVFNTPRDRKITAIKTVRDYCIKNNYDSYSGLKDAKDYVERATNGAGDLLFPPRW